MGVSAILVAYALSCEENKIDKVSKYTEIS